MTIAVQEEPEKIVTIAVQEGAMNGEKRSRKHRKEVLILAAFALLGAGIFYSQRQEIRQVQSDGILRSEPGEGEKTETFEYRIGNGEKKEMEVTVAERQLTQEEAMELLTQAREEWEEAWLGDNESASRVSSDLYLPETLQDGMVEVEYRFSDYDVLNSFGEIDGESLTEEGTEVTLTAVLSCGGCELPVEKIFTAKKAVPEGEAAAEAGVAESVMRTEEQTRQENRFFLPDTWNGQSVSWTAKTPVTGLFFALFGVLLVFLMRVRSAENQKQEKKRRREQLMAGYPQMVDQMALLLGGGMSIRGAWERMAAVYEQMRRNHALPEQLYMEEMLITWREICDGRGERECYERFGLRAGIAAYRRFSSILAQNLSRGSADIRRILEEESRDAAEERLHRVRRLGEEAGSRLLGPMMLMFVIVLVTVMVPALVSFSF